MGRTIYYEAIPNKYYHGFKEVFESEDPQRLNAHLEWLMAELRGVRNKASCYTAWHNFHEVYTPVANSPLINEGVREDVALILTEGEGKRHFLRDHQMISNYISTDSLERCLKTLSDSGIYGFRNYAISFFESYRQKDKNAPNRTYNDFIDAYLSNDEVNWEAKYEVLLEKEKQRVDRSKKALAAGTDILFQSARPKNPSSDVKKPEEMIKSTAKLPSEEEVKARSLKSMVAELEAGYLVFRELTEFLTSVSSQQEESWILLH